jgi:arsenate reductase
MSEPRYHVLFICTGNSARSILAEAALRHLGNGVFAASSAGSHPTGKVNPLALEVLRERGIAVDGLRSKSWDELGGPAAPALDLVFTVCDKAAGEACPLWIGTPVTAHWGVEDPAAVEGSPEEKKRAFRNALVTLSRRIELLVALPLATLDRMALRARLAEIGRS